MSLESKLQLSTSSILKVPLSNYFKDFSFIVNGKEFKTNRFISNILSPIICKIHSSDQTFDIFPIKTHHKGDFNYILKLINFKENMIPKSQLPFIIEIIEALGNDSLKNQLRKEIIEISIDDTILKINKLDENSDYSLHQAEIDIISSHFYELCDEQEEKLLSLPIQALYQVLKSDKLNLHSEDQLFEFINKLYSRDSAYSILYETIIFENIAPELIHQFLTIFQYENLTGELWLRLSSRLENQKTEKVELKERYRQEMEKAKSFDYTKENEFKGIINNFMIQTKGQIEQKVNITSSSVYNDKDNVKPTNVALFDDTAKFFSSGDEEDSWIRFDFRGSRVLPSGYTIRSAAGGQNDIHPRSWVIEGSNDEETWVTIHKVDGCDILNGKNIVHTFIINNKESETRFRFIQMRLTGPNWFGFLYKRECAYCLTIDSFELYGHLIE